VPASKENVKTPKFAGGCGAGAGVATGGVGVGVDAVGVGLVGVEEPPPQAADDNSNTMRAGRVIDMSISK